MRQLVHLYASWVRTSDLTQCKTQVNALGIKSEKITKMKANYISGKYENRINQLYIIILR